MGLMFIKVSRQVKLLDKMGTKKKSLIPVDFNRLMSHQCMYTDAIYQFPDSFEASLSTSGSCGISPGAMKGG